MQNIAPLVTLNPAGFSTEMLFHVICRDCGNVTRTESGGTVNDAPIVQAGLYRQRHLAKHLEALSREITDAAR